jgi:hypothetical protein
VLDLPELTDVDHFPDALAVAARCAPGSRTRRVVEGVAALLTRACPSRHRRPPTATVLAQPSGSWLSPAVPGSPSALSWERFGSADLIVAGV